jgi:tritrans,polycis-undecaprenyl-diphosphate synthase [geranylgeranyl-diphosphate specific]
MGLSAWLGHENGLQKMKDVAFWSFKDFGIRTLTIYAFSTENFKRQKNEVKKLMELFASTFEKMKDDPTLRENRVRVTFIGKRGMLPGRVRKSMEAVERETKKYDDHALNIAIAYDGREEIVNAAMGVSKAGRPMTAKNLESALWLSGENPPDLIIRTSGERRLSGFLLWQASYSELYFSDKLWPEFGKRDLEMALNDFKKRHRRFGK